MELIVHRGTNQIGGCATELRSKNSRILIDFGSQLPNPDGTQRKDLIREQGIEGLTFGKPAYDGVLFTHAHGDHIGNIDMILPEIPLYMGETAREMSLSLNGYLRKASQYGIFGHAQEENQIKKGEALKRAHTFEKTNKPDVKKSFNIGDFKIIPLKVDHSACDSYMFLIEAEGKRILHTGDFRNHGYLGGQLIHTLQDHVGSVDWLITEGTMLSRESETVLTEEELSQRAKDMIAPYKNVFVFCSSTNIDRILAFKRAAGERTVLCDGYQFGILKSVQPEYWKNEEDNPFKGEHRIEVCSKLSKPSADMPENAQQNGFLMLVRNTEKFSNFMKNYKDNCIVLYSQWGGYLENSGVKQFLDGFQYARLHTSGHATPETLQKVAEAVHPREGILPIHTEKGRNLKKLLPQYNVVLMKDKQTLEIQAETSNIKSEQGSMPEELFARKSKYTAAIKDVKDFCREFGEDVLPIPHRKKIICYYKGIQLIQIGDNAYQFFNRNENEKSTVSALPDRPSLRTSNALKRKAVLEYYTDHKDEILEAFDGAMKKDTERPTEQMIAQRALLDFQDRTGYVVCGMETAFSSWVPQLEKISKVDLVAINPTEKKILLIELKCNKNALIGNAKDIVDHCIDYSTIKQWAENDSQCVLKQGLLNAYQVECELHDVPFDASLKARDFSVQVLFLITNHPAAARDHSPEQNLEPEDYCKAVSKLRSQCGQKAEDAYYICYNRPEQIREIPKDIISDTYKGTDKLSWDRLIGR